VDFGVDPCNKVLTTRTSLERNHGLHCKVGSSYVAMIMCFLWNGDFFPALAVSILFSIVIFIKFEVHVMIFVSWCSNLRTTFHGLFYKNKYDYLTIKLYFIYRMVWVWLYGSLSFAFLQCHFPFVNPLLLSICLASWYVFFLNFRFPTQWIGKSTGYWWCPTFSSQTLVVLKATSTICPNACLSLAIRS